MVIGIWVLILPFLGFPGDWEKTLAFLTGIVIIGVSYRLKPEEGTPGGASSAASASYVEHRSDPVPSALPNKAAESQPEAAASDSTTTS